VADRTGAGYIHFFHNGRNPATSTLENRTQISPATQS
jgi:hypothetical protein